MGILDGYNFDPNQQGGILGMLAPSLFGAGMNLPAQPPSGFPAGPTDMSSVNRNGGTGVTLPQLDASGLGRDAGASNPFASLLGGLGNAVGGLFGGSGPQAAPAQPGAPQAPQAPQMPQAPGPGFLDRLTAGATNLTTGGNPLAGLLNAVSGVATGQRTDPMGIMLAQQQATAQALVQAGVPPSVAHAAALNPEVLKTIAPQLYSKPTPEKLKDALGNERIVFANPDTRTVTEPGAGSGGGGAGMTGPQILAPGVKTYDPTLPADAYMAQFSPDMQASIKSYMNGDVMPTGNPRQMGMANAAKGFAQLYGQKAGVPVSDQIYAEKRKLRTDLAASSNNSMGGILSNGDSAFAHLAELSGSMAALGNYAGPNVPGGAHIGDIGNVVSNSLFPTPVTKGKLQAIQDNALKYGQEATKLYAGSGGGEAERMHALDAVAGAGTNAEVQAAFLEKEKSLMLDRMRAKFAQIRDTLGDEEAQKIIAKKSPSLEANVAKIDANIARLRGQGGPAQQQQSQQAPQAQAGPPAGAVSALRQNPALAAQFDAKYGQGAAARIMGGQ